MYEYDPKTKQYRRKGRDDDASPETEEKAEIAAKAPEFADVPAEQNPHYAIEDEEDVNFKPPRPPGMTVGKIAFWVLFAVIFSGWMYFMYTMYLKDQQGAPADIEALLEEDEEFNDIMNNAPDISPEDIKVDSQGIITNQPAVPPTP